MSDQAATDPDSMAPGATRQPSGEPEMAEPATASTGHPAVDEAVARLAEQADLPPAEQVAGYEAAQRALSQTLASIDES